MYPLYKYFQRLHISTFNLITIVYVFTSEASVSKLYEEYLHQLLLHPIQFNLALPLAELTIL